MSTDLYRVPECIVLLANTGIQFVDLEFHIDWAAASGPVSTCAQGLFITSGWGAERRLIRLLPAGGTEQRYNDPLSGRSYAPSGAEYRYRSADALTLFNEIWLPLPYQTLRADGRLGPADWARVRIVELAERSQGTASAAVAGAAGLARRQAGRRKAVQQRRSYCITLAFDTRIEERALQPGTLGPAPGDLEPGVSFELRWQCPEAGDFLRDGGCGQPWVSQWCSSVFTLLAQERLYPNKGEVAIGDAVHDRLEHEAHYLNLLAILGSLVHVPRVMLRPGPGQARSSVDFSLYVDIGMSRCSALMVEHQPGAHDAGEALQGLRELRLRDLNASELRYSGPFASCAEFAEAAFVPYAARPCPDHPGAFCWPSLVRLGPEAQRLAANPADHHARTGVHSPLGCLGHDETSSTCWFFNPASYQIRSRRLDRQPRILRLARLPAVSRYLNERGEALFSLSGAAGTLSSAPRYTGRALMTFALLELLVQALVQMNAHAQRTLSAQADRPRRLARLVMALPPAMPFAERARLRSCVYEALGIVWKCLGYDQSGDRLSFSTEPGAPGMTVAVPEVIMDWDEAQALQTVYICRVLGQEYQGRPQEWLQHLRSQPGELQGQAGADCTGRLASLTVGSACCGLAIFDYALDRHGERGPELVSHEVLREALHVGREHLVDELLHSCLLPAVTAASAGPALAEHAASRSAAMHLLADAARGLLLMLESLVGDGPWERVSLSIAQLLGSDTADPLSAAAQAGTDDARFHDGDEALGRLANVCLELDVTALHRQLLRGDGSPAVRALRQLLALAAGYRVQQLVLCGYSSSLPGVRRLAASELGLAAERIVVMDDCGMIPGLQDWDSLQGGDRVGRAAVVGAMLCQAGCDRCLWRDLDYRPAVLTAVSELRYFGVLNSRGQLPHASVYYAYAPEAAQQRGVRHTARDDGGWHPLRFNPASGAYEAVSPKEDLLTLTLPAYWGARQLPEESCPAVPLYLIDLLSSVSEHVEVIRARHLPIPEHNESAEDFIGRLTPEIREQYRRRLQGVTNEFRQLEARLIHERGTLLKELRAEAADFAQGEARRVRRRQGLLGRVLVRDRSAAVAARAAAEYEHAHLSERVDAVLAQRREHETKRLQLQRLSCWREALSANLELVTARCAARLEDVRLLLQRQGGVCSVSVELMYSSSAWQQQIHGHDSAVLPVCRLGRVYCGSDGRDYSDFFVMRLHASGDRMTADLAPRSDTASVRQPGGDGVQLQEPLHTNIHGR